MLCFQNFGKEGRKNILFYPKKNIDVDILWIKYHANKVNYFAIISWVCSQFLSVFTIVNIMKHCDVPKYLFNFLPLLYNLVFNKNNNTPFIKKNLAVTDCNFGNWRIKANVLNRALTMRNDFARPRVITRGF